MWIFIFYANTKSIIHTEINENHFLDISIKWNIYHDYIVTVEL